MHRSSLLNVRGEKAGCTMAILATSDQCHGGEVMSYQKTPLSIIDRLGQLVKIFHSALPYLPVHLTKGSSCANRGRPNNNNNRRGGQAHTESANKTAGA